MKRAFGFTSALVLAMGVIAIGQTTNVSTSAAADGEFSVTTQLQTLAAQLPKPETSTVVLQEFDHSISVDNAVLVAENSERPVTAIRIENAGVSAEFSLLDGLTSDEFTEWFLDLYGTRPQASGLQVRVEARETAIGAPNESEKELSTHSLVLPSVDLKPIVTGFPEFIADKPIGGSAYEQFASPDLSQAGIPVGEVQTAHPLASQVPVGVSWAPSYMELRVERVGSRQYFYQFANWRFGADPGVRPQVYYCGVPGCRTVDWGMEFGIDLYNNNLTPGLKPACQSNNESQFLALNEGYSWGVTQGPSSVALTTNAYKDDWEVTDSCRKNSFAIGLGMPWNIPQNSNGFEQILISINAPTGGTASSIVSGTVTLNDNYYCVLGAALTNCMGDGLLAPPAPYDAGRLTLREGRNWIAAPNKCWISASSGTVSPALTIPFDSDGCF